MIGLIEKSRNLSETLQPGELFQIIFVLGAQYYRQLAKNMGSKKNHREALFQSPDIIRHKYMPREYKIVESTAYLRHYLRVFAIHLIGYEEGYNTYKEVLQKSELPENFRSLIDWLPDSDMKYNEAKLSFDLDQIVDQMSVAMSALSVFTNIEGEEDTLANLPDGIQKILRPHSPNRDANILDLLEAILIDLNPKEVIEINKKILEFQS